MPTYEYQCGVCGEVTERHHIGTDRTTPEHCGTDMSRVLLTPPSVKFVGDFSGGTATKDKWAFKGKRSPAENVHEAKKNEKYKREAADRKRQKFVGEAVSTFDI